MRRTSLVSAVAFVMLLMLAGSAWAQDDGQASTRLRGFEEVPALSSPGGGQFESTLAGNQVQFELSYFQTRGTVTQAHIHFAQRGVNGGIMVFLCSNLGNGPAGTQACPAAGTKENPAVVSGTFDASDVIGGANAQGIAPGEFQKVLRAIRAGAAYVNVHTDLFPGGEIRGQLLFLPAGE